MSPTTPSLPSSPPPSCVGGIRTRQVPAFWFRRKFSCHASRRGANASKKGCRRDCQKERAAKKSCHTYIDVKKSCQRESCQNRADTKSCQKELPERAVRKSCQKELPQIAVERAVRKSHQNELSSRPVIKTCQQELLKKSWQKERGGGRHYKTFEIRTNFQRKNRVS